MMIIYQCWDDLEEAPDKPSNVEASSPGAAAVAFVQLTDADADADESYVAVRAPDGEPRVYCVERRVEYETYLDKPRTASLNAPQPEAGEP
jgi:hypothetical protein